MVIDAKEIFLKKMASTVVSVSKAESPQAGQARIAHLPTNDRVAINRMIMAGTHRS